MEWNEQEPMAVGCPETGQLPAKLSLAMSYVPNQAFEGLYDEKTAFTRGTLFKGLDFPFTGGKRRWLAP